MGVGIQWISFSEREKKSLLYQFQFKRNINLNVVIKHLF